MYVIQQADRLYPAGCSSAGNWSLSLLHSSTGQLLAYSN
uniref:Uncharacterized protein n=1 Tax=Arundo donax TaxID=35708 RepID=A0A0A9BYJ6_ARUDO